MQAQVGVSKVVAQELLQQGKAVPTPGSGWALIDTGASKTCIDESLAQQLGLPVIDVVRISSASHAAAEGNLYAAQIELIGLPFAIEAKAIGGPLSQQGLIALIGRDVLQRCTLFYNGPAGTISLAL